MDTGLKKSTINLILIALQKDGKLIDGHKGVNEKIYVKLLL